MAHRIKAPKDHPELDFSQKTPSEPEMPKVKDIVFTLGDARRIASQIPQGIAVGRIELTQKVDRLFVGLQESHTQRALKQLSLSSMTPQEYAIILETLDYAKLRDNLGYALEGIEKERDERPFNIAKMKRMLSLGIVFDELTRKIRPEALDSEKDYMTGGTGYGSNVRIHGDIVFPQRKKDLAQSIEGMGIDHVKIRGGAEVRPMRAPIRQLHAIYASQIRERRKMARRAERRLDEI
jgi:hypothetical protein